MSMDFIDQVKQYSKRVESLKDNLSTEEATKTALIMPFFSMLRYEDMISRMIMTQSIKSVRRVLLILLVAGFMLAPRNVFADENLGVYIAGTLPEVNREALPKSVIYTPKRFDENYDKSDVHIKQGIVNDFGDYWSRVAGGYEGNSKYTYLLAGHYRIYMEPRASFSHVHEKEVIDFDGKEKYGVIIYYKYRGERYHESDKALIKKAYKRIRWST